MTFKPNIYFANEVISFTVKADEQNEQTVEVIGTEIEWKDPGKDPTKVEQKRTKRDRETGAVKVVVKTKPLESFFNAFQSLKLPDKLLNADVDEDDLEDIDSDDDKIMQQLEETHDIAEDLFELYHKDALETFLGFGVQVEGLLSDSSDFSDGDYAQDGSSKDQANQALVRHQNTGASSSREETSPRQRQRECK